MSHLEGLPQPKNQPNLDQTNPGNQLPFGQLGESGQLPVDQGTDAYIPGPETVNIAEDFLATQSDGQNPPENMPASPASPDTQYESINWREQAKQFTSVLGKIAMASRFAPKALKNQYESINWREQAKQFTSVLGEIAMASRFAPKALKNQSSGRPEKTLFEAPSVPKPDIPKKLTWHEDEDSDFNTAVMPVVDDNPDYETAVMPPLYDYTSTPRGREGLRNAYIGRPNEQKNDLKQEEEIRNNIERDALESMQYEAGTLANLLVDNGIKPEVSVEFRDPSNPNKKTVREGWLVTRMESSAATIKQLVDRSTDLPQHAFMVGNGELKADTKHRDFKTFSNEFGQLKIAQFMIGTDGGVYGLNGLSPFPDNAETTHETFMQYLKMMGAREPRKFPYVNDNGLSDSIKIYDQWTRSLNMVLDRYRPN